jgi:hypothetical protein
MLNFFSGTVRAALLVLAAAAAPLAASEPLGVMVGNERIPVIDMHIHVGQWAMIPPRAQRRNLERIPRPVRPYVVPFFDSLISADGVVGEMDKAAVNMGVVFASFFPHTSGVADNAFVAQQVRLQPRRLVALASLRVDQWNRDAPAQLAELERALVQDGMIGIKLAPPHAQTRLDDERLYPIYELAARLRKPMYIHTGTSPFPGTRQEPPYANPDYLEAAIIRYPEAVFVLGHAGYDTANHTLGYLESCIRLVKTYPNVQIEMGALGAPKADELTRPALRRFREAGVIDRVLYGSDGPQGPGYLRRHLERTVEAMQAEGYTVDEMRAVFAGNFQRVFGLMELATEAP